MSAHTVSSHLHIDVAEYDARIRTFVPFYEDMLDELEALVDRLAPASPAVLDLGTGTGAVLERCRRVRPDARLAGIDADPAMLEVAAARLGGRSAELRAADYLEAELPPSDVLASCIALHHVPDPGAKRALYARCHRALRPGGILVLADCYAPRRRELLEAGMRAWQRHLEGHYTPAEAAGHLAAWAEEDTYMPLADELDWLAAAGFRVEVVWRRQLFAVLLGTRHEPESEEDGDG